MVAGIPHANFLSPLALVMCSVKLITPNERLTGFKKK